MKTNLDGHWCLSGGASGADISWGMAANRANHRVIHFSFNEHKTLASPEQIVSLSEAELAAADPHCRLANRTLRRRFPTRSRHVTNLLRRDWYQVNGMPAHGIPAPTSCYAVSTFDLPIRTTLPLGTVIRKAQIKGGTAWAVTMFINRHQWQECACYVFDQQICHWFHWIGGGWGCIYEPPRPQGIWAGIGSRELNRIGDLAIRVLMDDAEIKNKP